MAKKKKTGSDAILDFCRKKLESADNESFNDILADLAFFVRQPIQTGEVDGFEVASLIGDAATAKGLNAADIIKSFREAT